MCFGRAAQSQKSYARPKIRARKLADVAAMGRAPPQRDHLDGHTRLQQAQRRDVAHRQSAVACATTRRLAAEEGQPGPATLTGRYST